TRALSETETVSDDQRGDDFRFVGRHFRAACVVDGASRNINRMSACFTEPSLQTRLQAEIVLAGRKEKALAVDRKLRSSFHDNVPPEARFGERIAHAEHRIAEAAVRAAFQLSELDVP